jgi:hypothetical protein
MASGMNCFIEINEIMIVIVIENIILFRNILK